MSNSDGAVLNEPYPILLAAQTPSLSNNKTVSIPDASFLANPTRQAMFIDEIRFTPLFAAAGTPNAPCSPALALCGCSLTLGRLSITNGFVPLHLFGKSLNPNDVYWRQGNAWRLPKPLYIPPGEILVPRFQYQLPVMPQSGALLADLASPFTVEVSYLGRVLPANCPVPRSIDVPWVSFWRSKLFRIDSAGSADSDISHEVDLVNPFSVPLHVQRFHGRLPAFGPAGVVAESNTNGATFVGSELLTLRMINSFGGVLVKDLTPFNDVFHPYDKAWTVNTVMGPKTFFVVNLSAAASPGSPANWNNYAVQAQIALIGYRRVRLAA